MSDSISTLAELKAASQTPTAARNRLTYLFDEGKFTELDAYAAAGDSLAGVITAFGYVEGNPVYAFSQDVTVKDGALTEAQAKKIAKVYDLAAKTGVPVVGIFDSYGADVSDGSKALNAYGELLMWTSNLSGVVPQIAVVAGTCAGWAAMLAESADFTVIAKDAELYVAPNANVKNSAENAAENGTAAVVCEDDKAAVEADLNALKEAINRAPIDNMTDAQVEDIKAGKEKLMNSAQALFSKVYEQAQAAGAAGAQGGAQGAADAGSAPHDDNVVDGDFKEV